MRGILRQVLKVHGVLGRLCGVVYGSVAQLHPERYLPAPPSALPVRRGSVMVTGRRWSDKGSLCPQPPIEHGGGRAARNGGAGLLGRGGRCGACCAQRSLQ